MDIQQVMEKTYKDMHSGPAPITEIAGRYEPEEGPNRFRLFMTEKRQDYIKRLEEEKSEREDFSKKKKCRLCCSSYAIIYDDHLVIRPDPSPMYDYHMLITPLKGSSSLENFELINGSYRLAYVAKDMLDCRAYPTKRDIDAGVRLVQDTDYMVMQSMTGSGASIPEHIHAHAFKSSLMKFPLLKEENFSELCQGREITVMKIESPSYGFMIQGDSGRYGAVINRLFNDFGVPFNLLLTEVSRNIVALYFPRIKEIPDDPIYGIWQFGVTEMLGLFETKNHEQFNRLTYERLCQGLRDTTVQDSGVRKQMEKSLVQISKDIEVK